MMTEIEQDLKQYAVKFIEKLAGTDNEPAQEKIRDLAVEALDNVTDFVFISDSITKNIIYMNKALSSVLKLKEGVTPSCYSVFRGNRAPCKNCRNNACQGRGFTVTHNNLRLLERSLILKSTQFTLDGHVYTISIGRPKEENGDLAPSLAELDDAEILNKILTTFSKHNGQPNLQIFSAIQFIGQLCRADSVAVYEPRQVDAHLAEEFQRSAFWSSDQISDVSDDPKENLPYAFIEQVCTRTEEFLYHTEELLELPEVYQGLSELKIERVLVLPVFHGQVFLGYVLCRNLSEEAYAKHRLTIGSLVDAISIMLYLRVQSIELDNTKNLDSLTGLGNRTALSNDLKSYAQQHDLGVVMVNINGMQAINQEQGVKAGDQVIIKIGNLIREILHLKQVYRISGDEFVGIYPDIAEQEFNKKCDVLSSFLSSKNTVTAALGSAWVAAGHQVLEAMTQAEKKMIERKKAFYRENPHVQRYRMGHDQMLDIMSPEHIHKLIDDGNFRVFYQPKFSLKDGSLCGAEALIRLFLNGSMVPPDAFIPPLDAAHYTYLIDLFVLEHVCKVMRARLDAGLEIRPVSCNFSRHTFIMSDFAKRLSAILQQYQISNDLITLEISEQSNTDFRKELIETASYLASRGFKISIDDFGVAHSNIWELAELPVNEVKFDKKLIDALLLGDNAKIVTILNVMMTMCRDLHIKTVAEGVEKESQEQILKNLGCDELQGYLRGRPVDEESYYTQLEKTPKLA
ncbi:MAG: GGDEF domain-containing phosphodiesterase [Succinivibrio sp.]|nr:GGDEF domain-containing phosphodiesterase [Succinivibrio sp.]